MTILRRHLSTGFTVLPTATLEDSRLSFRARGILAFLIAKPDSWRVRAESIAAAGKEGVEAVKTALRELKDHGYYRVVTERLKDGTLRRITEVYDTAQEWAAKEYRALEQRRVARKRKRQATTGTSTPGAGESEALEETEGTDGETESGFSGVGFPAGGSPDGGCPDVLVSNQSQYPEENPPTPTADAAGEPGNTAPVEAEMGGCPTHPDGPGRSCRGCGTSPRQLREAQERAEREAFKARERAANEQVLAQVRRVPGTEGLSQVARDQLAAMRSAGRAATEKRREVESSRKIG
ncbi:hypothetical protein ACQF36_22380 [Streptomyces sp. Marseille-Q5077]|uniref:hypothetical protein n=1 Tax=Streptomyces sp. Marseille-Q5077 TaxID=3418995 RepID=UPI003CFE4E56